MGWPSLTGATALVPSEIFSPSSAESSLVPPTVEEKEGSASKSLINAVAKASSIAGGYSLVPVVLKASSLDCFASLYCTSHLQGCKGPR